MQQYMHMPSLWHALARLYLLSKGIALDHRHLFEMVREHAACQKPGHARPDHHGMLAAEAALEEVLIIHIIAPSRVFFLQVAEAL